MPPDADNGLPAANVVEGRAVYGQSGWRVHYWGAGPVKKWGVVEFFSFFIFLHKAIIPHTFVDGWSGEEGGG